MDLKQAMVKRHLVRKYQDKKLSESDIKKLNEKINEINKKGKLDLKLITNDKQGVSLLFRLLLAKNANNYVILAGDNSESIGYYGAELILFAQTIGMNTWWIGATYNHKVVEYVDNKKIIGIIVIGYGQTPGKPHKSKKVEEVYSYEGEAPEWFINGVKAALLAPTAINRQAFHIYGNDKVVDITYFGHSFGGENLGLVKYHFELGAGKENFTWK